METDPQSSAPQSEKTEPQEKKEFVVQRSLLSPFKDLLQILVFGLALVLLLLNWKSLDIFIERFLHNAVEVSIGDIIEVKVTEKETGTTETQSWAAFYRTSGTLLIDNAAFDDDVTGIEYVQFTATTDLDLHGAYIGDIDEMLQIYDGDFFVHSGETVRIYTFVSKDAPNESKPEAQRRPGMKVLVAKSLKKPLKDGIFKDSIGKGDRIVVINRKQQILLDLDYWWIENP